MIHTDAWDHQRAPTARPEDRKTKTSFIFSLSWENHQLFAETLYRKINDLISKNRSDQKNIEKM